MKEKSFRHLKRTTTLLSKTKGQFKNAQAMPSSIMLEENVLCKYPVDMKRMNS